MSKARPSNRQITWEGEKNRPLQACRPCSCGCDARDGGPKGVGYIKARGASDEIVMSRSYLLECRRKHAENFARGRSLVSEAKGLPEDTAEERHKKSVMLEMYNYQTEKAAGFKEGIDERLQAADGFFPDECRTCHGTGAHSADGSGDCVCKDCHGVGINVPEAKHDEA